MTFFPRQFKPDIFYSADDYNWQVDAKSSMVWYVYGKTQQSRNSHSSSFFHFCLLDPVQENNSLLKSKEHSVKKHFKGIMLFIFNDARVCAIMPKTNLIRKSLFIKFIYYPLASIIYLILFWP